MPERAGVAPKGAAPYLLTKGSGLFLLLIAIPIRDCYPIVTLTVFLWTNKRWNLSANSLSPNAAASRKS